MGLQSLHQPCVAHGLYSKGVGCSQIRNSEHYSRPWKASILEDAISSSKKNPQKNDQDGSFFTL